MSAEALDRGQCELLAAARGVSVSLESWAVFGRAAHEYCAHRVDSGMKRKDAVAALAKWLELDHTDSEGNHYPALLRAAQQVNRALKYKALESVCPWAADMPSEASARELLPLVKWNPDSGGQPAKKGMRKQIANVRGQLDTLRQAGTSINAENVRRVLVDLEIVKARKKTVARSNTEKLMDLADEIGPEKAMRLLMGGQGAPINFAAVSLVACEVNDAQAKALVRMLADNGHADAVIELACELTDGAGQATETAAA